MRIYPLNTGNFKLDGGAMFGVVPKNYGSEQTRQMKTISATGLCVLC